MSACHLQGKGFSNNDAHQDNSVSEIYGKHNCSVVSKAWQFLDLLPIKNATVDDPQGATPARTMR